MTKKEQIIEMRNQGMTLQAIADEFGCSKQYVHQELNRERKAIEKMKNKIVYKNILHWCIDNDIKVSDLYRSLSGSYNSNYRFLTKENFAVEKVKEILKFTGMTFEQAFGGTECED